MKEEGVGADMGRLEVFTLDASPSKPEPTRLRVASLQFQAPRLALSTDRFCMAEPLPGEVGG